jgi:hypothetical protein
LRREGGWREIETKYEEGGRRRRKGRGLEEERD